MLKRAVIIAAIAVLMSLMASSVYAALPESEGVFYPNYDNALNANATLTVTGGTASLTGSLVGKSGVTKIKCTLTLQKKSSSSWSGVESWSKEVNASSMTFTKTRTVSHGTYRAKATFKVYKGGSYETITKYSSQKTY